MREGGPAFVQLRAVARGDRNAATARIRDAFGEAGVFLTEVHFFSGVMTVFTFEGDAGSVRGLAAVLARAGADVDEEAHAALARLAGDGETAGTLAVTFADGDPDLRREIPSVPG